MTEIHTHVNNNVASSPHPTTKCVVCGDQALRPYLGVIVCAPCRVFFKRSVTIDQARLKCPFDGHCQIHILNRQACRCCRLRKCFACGMQSERLRGSRGKPPKRPTNNRLIPQLPTLNLLRADQSMMCTEQWNLLSNLIHCYDEHGGLAVADRFVREQNALPIKSRFKVARVTELFTVLMGDGHLLFEKNTDYLSLSAHDRSVLCDGRSKHVGWLSACFTVHSAGLFDNTIFCQTVELVYGPASFLSGKRMGKQLSSDVVLLKLVMAIVLLSMSDLAMDAHAPSIAFEDEQAILRMQHVYTDLTWRYLLYKCDYAHAAVHFSHLTFCILTMNKGFVEATSCEQA